MSEVKLVRVETAADLEAARRLFQEYGESLSFYICFESFERELASLPGEYAPAHGTLLLALHDSKAAGCAALRKIDAGTGEMKRLYVRPECRGTGIGRQLAVAVIDAARRMGYSRLILDTLPGMKAAQALYQSLGFTKIQPAAGTDPAAPMDMELHLK